MIDGDRTAGRFGADCPRRRFVRHGSRHAAQTRGGEPPRRERYRAGICECDIFLQSPEFLSSCSRRFPPSLWAENARSRQAASRAQSRSRSAMTPSSRSIWKKWPNTAVAAYELWRVCGRPLHVRCVGFTPGFPTSAPARRFGDPAAGDTAHRSAGGSVAIGGGQAGIYPLPLAGRLEHHWTTPCAFQRHARAAALFAAGDQVHFVAIKRGVGAMGEGNHSARRSPHDGAGPGS